MAATGVERIETIQWPGLSAAKRRAGRLLSTELAPLGVFRNWQAERAAGDHDRNTLRLRLDPQGDATTVEPGMTIRVSRRSI